MKSILYIAILTLVIACDNEQTERQWQRVQELHRINVLAQRTTPFTNLIHETDVVTQYQKLEFLTSKTGYLACLNTQINQINQLEQQILEGQHLTDIKVYPISVSKPLELQHLKAAQQLATQIDSLLTSYTIELDSFVRPLIERGNINDANNIAQHHRQYIQEEQQKKYKNQRLFGGQQFKNCSRVDALFILELWKNRLLANQVKLEEFYIDVHVGGGVLTNDLWCVTPYPLANQVVLGSQDSIGFYCREPNTFMNRDSMMIMVNQDTVYKGWYNEAYVMDELLEAYENEAFLTVNVQVKHLMLGWIEKGQSRLVNPQKKINNDTF